MTPIAHGGITKERLAEITEIIERNRRNDLDTLVKRNEMFLREAWVNMAIFVADKTDEDQLEEHKVWLRNRKETGKRGAKNIENLARAARVHGFAEAAELSENASSLAESMQKRNDEIGKILRKNAKKHNHKLIILLNSVLRRYKLFDCWEALSRVIAEAYIAFGREAKARRMTADSLQKLVTRYCKKVT